MSNDYSLEAVQKQLIIENAKKEIRECNSISERFGLTLNEEDIAELVEGRKEALIASGRIEFGGGILPKLIYAFCDSPYINQSNYESTLAELQEAFYYYKNDSEDIYTDDELIEFMVKVFNGRAQGSTEYMLSTSVDALCRYARAKSDAIDENELGDLF